VTVENAAEYVKANKAEGADYIKLFQENGCSFAMPTDSVPSATLALQSAVTAAGHAEGLLVVAHANSVAATKIVLNAGVDGLTHTFVDQAPPQSIVDLYKAKGAFVIPTLTVLASLTAEQQARRDKFAAIARQNDLVDELTGELKAKSVGWSDPGAKFEFAVQTVKKLKQEGIDILAGTDSMAGLPGTAIGPSLWMELEMYVELCGMSATEALHSATALPAKRLDFPDRGVIAAGKKADLVLVKGNVTERLQHLWEGEGIVGMWKEGLAAEWFHERLQKLRDVEQ
jgi:imidazolonepropionase-like amidohydrolase